MTIRYKVKKGTSVIVFKLNNGHLKLIDEDNYNPYENEYQTRDIIFDEYTDCCFYDNSLDHPYLCILKPNQLNRLQKIHQSGYVVLHRNYKETIDTHYIIAVPSSDIHYLRGHHNDE